MRSLITTFLSICLVCIMVGTATSQTSIEILSRIYAFKSYDDVKKHMMLIKNKESDTPFMTEGLRNGRIVIFNPGDSVTVIEEMKFLGLKIWMFKSGSWGNTFYSWATLAFDPHGKKEINSKFIDAAYRGSLEEVRLFLNIGADINAENSIGQTALDMAHMFHHEWVASYLRARGAKYKHYLQK